MRQFISIKKGEMNPRERDVFKHSNYFECENFNYTYSAAVNSYKYAHAGDSRKNKLNGVVLTEEEWNSVVTKLRQLVTDKYMRSISVFVFYWASNPKMDDFFESGFVFKYADEIVAYSVWDTANLSGYMDIVRITDDGYLI